MTETQFTDQRDIDAQNWGAAEYAAYTTQIKAEGGALVRGFAMFVVGALAFVGVLVWALILQ